MGLPRRNLLALGLSAVPLAGLAACSSGGGDAKVKLRLGYLPNITHAVPLVGLGTGRFAKALGKSVTLTGTSFNAGPDEVTALLSGAIDVGYMGPNPTVNAWSQSKGQAIKVIAGAASGGASLVVNKKIKTWSDLKGASIATPQLGNTQDVSARYFMKQHGLSTNEQGGGDVHIKPMDNGTAVTSFTSGAIDGAWIPEPYATEIVQAGGHVLVDERTLWPDGKFVVTDLVVRTDFLNEHADVVHDLLAAQVSTVDFIQRQPAQAQQQVSTQIGKASGKPLELSLVKDAWPKMAFTNDPLAATLASGAKHAEDVGLLDPVNLKGLYDLGPLNKILAAKGRQEVSASLTEAS
jgi:sulfonate transport system substrate-binding protein